MGARVISNCLPVCNENCTNNEDHDSKHGYDATINLQLLNHNSERKASKCQSLEKKI